jgi:hypothetical protein
MDHIHVLGEEIGLPSGELSVVQHGVWIEKLWVQLTNIKAGRKFVYTHYCVYNLERIEEWRDSPICTIAVLSDNPGGP